MTPPKSSAAGEAENSSLITQFRCDALSGFLVFLIALPLCLAIAKASGFPPIGGVITAIVGGLVASFISNSALTIKGPAAGLIAIVAACVADFGGTFGKDAAADYSAYRMVLAVGACAAVIQILFGLFKAGKLGDFFPTAAVHGLLASIGVMIMIRQFLVMLGVGAKLPVEARDLLMEYPQFITQYNLPIAIVGLSSLAIMIFYPLIKVKALKALPVQMVVLIVAIPLAMYLNLHQPTPEELAAKAAAATTATQAANTAATPSAAAAKTAGVAAPPIDPKHSYTIAGKEWSMDPTKYLINVPDNFMKAFVTPDFAAFNKWGIAIKWVLMFAIIASLESLLSAKAVDLLDPQRRKTDLNRDLLACGTANLISSFIGGLPMISEIVRSRANVDNGAKSRWSNVFHGVFLLLFAALLPFVLKLIPIAALAAMLTFTGFRLAHPREFMHMYKIGIEQFVVFVSTIIAIICTDLLIGVLIGMALELVINLFSGLSITAIFSSGAEVSPKGENTFVIVPHNAAVFSNWLSLRACIEKYGLRQNKNIVVDLSSTSLVDHTVMEKLREMEREFEGNKLKLEIIGLESHRAVSAHPAAARKRNLYAVSG